MKRIAMAAAMAVLVGVCGAAFGQEAQPAAPPQEKTVLDVIEPTQGRPVIVLPEQNFHFMFWMEDVELQKLEASLVHSLSPSERVPLTAPVPPFRIQNAYWAMILKPPALAKPGVYDLYIDMGQYYQRIPRAVKIVAQFKDRFRFVHLSNMNVGEPTAPDFDSRLVDEINLLNPEFIVATGDYLDQPGRNSPDDWRRIMDFFARFDAPAYLLCGDMEDPAVFQKAVDSSPIGSFDYGGCHFVLTLDTQTHPIDQHQTNVEAVLENLKEARNAKMSVLVGRSDGLRILDGLRAIGRDPVEVFAQYKVRMMICGGSTDWDFLENADKLETIKAAGVQYVRTGQSSTSMKNGGSGVSRYRVFEVNGQEIDCAYRPLSPDREAQHSIPAGRLRVFDHGRNDGSAATEHVSVVNTLNQSFGDCRVVMRIKGDDPQAVKVANCRLEEVLRGPGHLVVLATVDVPERASVQVAATTDPQVEQSLAKLPVEFAFGGDRTLKFRQGRSPDGMVYYEQPGPIPLTVKNLSDQQTTVSLQVRLGGEALVLSQTGSTQPGDASAQAAALTTTETLSLAPNATASVSIHPVLRNLTPGQAYLAVYCLNDPLQRVSIERVNVTLAPQ
ncbi:MAG: hypothetical protein GXY33_07370 [Phycisphaerae bacterium]|nr:hypothetical protein [Phycisphaerae bacterium]